ncbi:MAG: hypothetical protein R2856_32825 [Caldilineaceae bacterium]
MNTVNWLDGLSGLVVGVTAIFMRDPGAAHDLRRGTAAVERGHAAGDPVGRGVGLSALQLCLALVFMGSSGSYFLGFALAVLGIIGGESGWRRCCWW